MPDQNIALLLTPPGTAAIAVVRLVGPAVGQFLATHFSKPLAVGRCVHGNLSQANRIIDDVVVVLLDENRADVNLHGGNWIVHSVLEMARSAGFFVSDRSLIPISDSCLDADNQLQREMLAHLPLARTELGVRALLAQPAAWDAMTSGEPSALRGSAQELPRILNDRTLWHLLHPPTVAIVGAANVGKSTLANQLFAQPISITADVPGTTRDWVGEIANIDGLPVMLMDTPGLRHTGDAIELTAIEQSRAEIEKAELVVLVLDASRPLDDQQLALMREDPPAIRVNNKCDCSPAWDLDSIAAIHTVATAGAGIGELRRAIVRFFCGEEQISVERPRWWTERQRAFLSDALLPGSFQPYTKNRNMS